MRPPQHRLHHLRSFRQQDVCRTSVAIKLSKVTNSSPLSIFSDPQLAHCQITTAAWHFAVTTTVLFVATLPPFNLFQRVRLPTLEVLPIACFFVGFLVLGNLSLALNSVAFYQLAKMMTMPTVVALNFLLWKKFISIDILLTILISTVGVTISGFQSASTNMLGLIVAVAAFVVTALYQIWIGKKINDLNVSPPQLLLNQAPVAVLLLLCIVPFSDTLPELAAVQPRALWALFGSGFLAAGVNLSQFLIIGRTSALTFNVIGSAKNTIIISLGWWRTGQVLGWTEVVGAALALGGASAYSWLVQKRK